AALSGAIAWRMHPAGRPTEPPAAPPVVMVVPDDPVDVVPVTLADAQDDSAVGRLRRRPPNGRRPPCRATVALAGENLRIIDHAIEQARQAVMADPGNSYLTSHLVETRRKKLDLLRRAAALANEAN